MTLKRRRPVSPRPEGERFRKRSPSGRGETGRNHQLSLQLSSEIAFENRAFLRKHLHRAHELLNPSLKELSLALVGDKTMSRLHEQFLSIPGPTDVLTFPLETDAEGHTIAGEVIVCVPEARRRARELGVPLERELLLYALHGMLHLIGHDDRTGSGFRTMHRTEDDILTALGVGPVFAVRARRAKTGAK